MIFFTWKRQGGRLYCLNRGRIKPASFLHNFAINTKIKLLRFCAEYGKIGGEGRNDEKNSL